MVSIGTSGDLWRLQLDEEYISLKEQYLSQLSIGKLPVAFAKNL
jgi:hypothetical protein